MARVVEQSERYADIIEFLKKIIKRCSNTLSMDAKNLLSDGFKNLISARRSDLKTIKSNKAYAFSNIICFLLRALVCLFSVWMAKI